MKIDEYKKTTPNSDDRIIVQSDNKTSSTKILNIVQNTEFNELNTNSKTLSGGGKENEN